MDLPNFFTSSDSERSQDLVLCVLISESRTQSLLLRFSTSGVHIRSTSSQKEYQNLEEAVSRVDESLSELGKEAEGVAEVVFAVPSSWVEKGDLAITSKPIIQKITQELALQPLGFIDMTEVAAQQLIAQNGLYSGLLVCISEKVNTFALINQGKSMGIESVGSSGEYGSDFAEILARSQKIAQKHALFLPSEMTLVSFDTPIERLREFQQQAYNLQIENEQAVSQPLAIAIWSSEDFLDSVAREAGKATALQKGLPNIALASSVVRNQQEVTQKSKEMGFDQLTDSNVEELPTSFGIPISNTSSSVLDIAEKEVDVILSAEADALSKKVKKSRKSLVFIFAGFALGILTLFLTSYVILPAIATVEVIVTPKKVLVSKEAEVVLDPSISESDPETLTIAAETITKSGTLENTLQTTGIKVVGEKAKGSVTVYNKSTAGSKTFAKGTVLKSGSLEFELDEEIQVASATAKPNGTDYGESKTSVTARQIGAESNLTKNAELTVVPFDTSTYNAFVTEAGLSGGSSREVRVVAQRDIDELLRDSRKELIEQINADLKESAPKGTHVIPSQKVLKQVPEFNAEVESQAESITLKLEIELETIAYSSAQLKPFAQKVLAEEIPENYALEDKDPEILFDSAAAGIGGQQAASGSAQPELTIAISIRAFAAPQINSEELLKLVTGTRPQEAQEILGKQPSIAKAEVLVKPAFATKFLRAIQPSVEKTHITVLE